MNTETQQTEQPIKRGRGRPKDAINKGGRPKADKKGALLWVSAEFVDAMNAYLELLKQQHNQRQAKQ
jgi:hypothetical protein